MKTNFDRVLETKMDAVKFIKELHDNNELFHFDEDVFEIAWDEDVTFTFNELKELDLLRDRCFELLPCPHLICIMVCNRPKEVYERYISIHRKELIK